MLARPRPRPATATLQCYPWSRILCHWWISCIEGKESKEITDVSVAFILSLQSELRVQVAKGMMTCFRRGQDKIGHVVAPF
jgi:hypothetical protein